MRCADEGGLGGMVQIAHRKCRTFLSTFCQLNCIKHGSSSTQCVVTTPKVGHLPQAGPGLRDSVVSIELYNFDCKDKRETFASNDEYLFFSKNRNDDPADESSWRLHSATAHKSAAPQPRIECSQEQKSIGSQPAR